MVARRWHWSRREAAPLTVVALVCACSGGGGSADTLPPVVPAMFERLDPALRATVQPYLEAVESDPGSPAAHAQLGVVYEANRLWPDALACYLNADRLGSTEALVLYRAGVASEKIGATTEALELYRRAVRQHPRHLPSLHRLGDLSLEAGELEEAEDALKRLLDLAPRELAGHTTMASLELRRGDAAAAAARLEPWVSTHPDVKQVRYVLGLAYLELGREEEADRELALGAGARKVYMPDAWGQTFPRFNTGLGAQSRIDEALAYLDSGDGERAAQMLEYARERFPDDPRVLSQLGRVLVLIGRGDEARPHLLRADELAPDDPATLESLASVHLNGGRADLALACAERALVRAPGNGALWIIKGRALLGTGRGADAVTAFSEAVRSAPDDVDAHMGLGSALASERRFPEAIRRFQEVTRTRPEYLQAHLVLISLHLNLGDTDSARAQLAVGRAIAPNDPQLAALARRIENAPR